jgi:murein DD-endopeptidase MepM/ murein hydrolase activator NlpD
MRLRRIALLAGLAAWIAPAASGAGPEGPRLAFPVACRIGETCEIQNYVDRDPGPGAKDYRCGSSTYEAHGGVDIRLPDMTAQRAGVAVLAAAPGRVSRLRDGVADISVKATGAPGAAGQECGNGVVIDHGNGWETQYCHLAKGSIGVKVGDTVATGQALARVGLSGNTEYPHLHITVRHSGATVDPFAPNSAPGACDPKAGSAQGLWDANAARAMSYKPGAVLNAGFAGGVVSPDELEEGRLPVAGRAAPALVAYVRAIDLRAGDVPSLTLKDPDGAVVGQSNIAPLERSKAQYLVYVGKKRPAAGWKPGTYVASYAVLRNGAPVVTRTFQLRL